MELATRHLRIAAGIAVASASVIGVAPVAQPSTDVVVSAVQLTASPAGIDPITAIEDVFKLSVANAEDIGDHFAPVPFPTLEQIIADPASFNLSEATTAAVTPFLPTGPDMMGAPPDFLYPSLTGIHKIVYEILVQHVLTSDLEKELLAFASSPLSSVLTGDLGPALDPGLALENSIQDALTAPDPTSALNDLVNIPTNIVDATLNGQFLDGTTPQLDLIPLLSLLPAGTLPAGFDITSLDLSLGGVFSPGGSLFNAIDVTISGSGIPPIVGAPVGPIASLIELDQAIAAALGFNFNDITPDLSTVGSPLEDLLSGLASSLGGDLPTSLTGGLSTELGNLSTDLLANLATSLF